MTKEELWKDWEGKIAEFKASGQNQSAWCREKNINLRNFNRWYMRLGKNIEKQEQGADWISLGEYVPDPVKQDAQIKVRIGNAVIEISPDFDSKLFSNVAKVLRDLC